MNGKYETISLDEVVASAKMNLNLDTGDYDTLFEKWANEAITHLGALSIFQKQEACLEICDYKAKLPHGFNSYIALYFTDEDWSATSELIYIDRKGIADFPLNSVHYMAYNDTFEIIDGYIHFNHNTDATHCKLYYYGLNEDKNGLMRVYSYYERGLTAYISWRYSQQNHKDIPVNLRDEYKREWQNQKNWIKGKDVKDEADNTRYELIRLSNALMTSRNTAH